MDDKIQWFNLPEHVRKNRKLIVDNGDISGLDSKVDKIPGKGLSANDYTDGDKVQVNNISPHIANSDIHTTEEEKIRFNNKTKNWTSGEFLTVEGGDYFRIFEGNIYEYTGSLPFTTLNITTELEEEPSKWIEKLKVGNNEALEEGAPNYYSYDVSAKEFMVYQNLNKNYFAGFKIKNINDASDYSLLWRLYDALLYKYDGEVMIDQQKELIKSGENECTYKIKDASDFTGGYHGDEKLIKAKFFQNGVEIQSLVQDIPLTSCVDFQYQQLSTMYTVDDPSHTEEATHYKITTFKDRGFTTFNRLKWLKTPDLDFYYHGICSIGTVVGSIVRNDYLDSFVPTGSEDRYLERLGAREYFASNASEGLSAYATSKLIKPSDSDEFCESFVWDRTTDNKYYRKFTPDTPPSIGEEYESEMKVQFNVFEKEVPPLNEFTGLLRSFSFEETSGTSTIEASGNNGVYSSGVLLNQPGKVNKNTFFDGVSGSSYLGQIGVNELPITIMGWVKSNNFAATGKQFALIGATEANYNGVNVYIHNDRKVTVLLGRGTGTQPSDRKSFMSDILIPDDVYTHLIVKVIDINTVIIKVNNTVSTLTESGTNTSVKMSVNGYNIGFIEALPNSHANGNIDELKVYNLITTDEVDTIIYNKESIGDSIFE